MIILSKNTETKINNFLAKPSHAVALAGVEGSGKQQLAQYTAAKMLDIPEDKISTHPYVRIITATAKDGIATVREVHNFLRLTVPGSASIRRCIVIADADKLGQEAQNALLKMLEEPPEDTVIITTVSDTYKLLDTVQSRMAWLQVYPISQEEALKHLQNEYKKEEIIKAWHISGGSVGLLVSILKDNENHPLVAAIEKARETLQQTSYERLIGIDPLVKDKNFDLLLFLDAMHRLLKAALNSAAAKQAQKETTTLTQQIKNTLYAKEQALYNVQPKLLLTELFYTLS